MVKQRREKKGYRVFKSTYKDRETGKPRKAARWAVEFGDGQRPRPRRLTAFTDRKASDELGRKLVKLVSLRSAGEGPDAELTRWIEKTPQHMREQLVKWRLLDAHRVTGSKTLSDHVDDYERALLAKGRTKKHATMTAQRARRVFDGSRFTFWADIVASTVQAYLAEMRDGDGDDDDGISIQTSNYYLTAVKGFCRWMVKDQRATQNPIDHLENLNANTDRKRIRRALSVDELIKLLTKTASQPERYGMTGHERALLYRLAVETGLRASELGSLTRASFDYDGDVPTVTVEAGHSKRKRRDSLPLRSETADTLRHYMANKTPTARAFNIPDSTITATMLRADLNAAGVAAKDDTGRIVDFHALRHTFITNLGRTGIHFKTQQELARHSTPMLTARYAHSFKHDEVAAVNALPTLPSDDREALRATGTDNATADTDAGLLGVLLGVNGQTAIAQLDHNGHKNCDQWPGGDSNPHDPLGSADFKSAASANSATGPWCCMSLRAKRPRSHSGKIVTYWDESESRQSSKLSMADSEVS